MRRMADDCETDGPCLATLVQRTELQHRGLQCNLGKGSHQFDFLLLHNPAASHPEI